MSDVSTTTVVAAAPRRTPMLERYSWRMNSYLSSSAAPHYPSAIAGGAPDTDSQAGAGRPQFYSRRSYPVHGGNWDTILLDDAAIDTGVASSSVTPNPSDTDNMARIVGAYCLWTDKQSRCDVQKNEELCFDEEYIPKSNVLEEKRAWDLLEIDDVSGHDAEDGVVCTSGSDAWRPLVMREIEYQRMSTASLSEGSSSNEELDDDDVDRYYSSETSASTPEIATPDDDRVLKSVEPNMLVRSLSQLKRRFSRRKTSASKWSRVPSTRYSSEPIREHEMSGTNKFQGENMEDYFSLHRSAGQ
ncbi:hypothetical protein POJ06DRAFT_239663 [Lipomyces tetrasporus]|uniref:Uncharacterized protein n=1 Tax=Lipomyces tetrasporus TaxID=54092 RepID=A0AAD7QPX4_9ASCO|nr:uncharacterized protein POJ06DRAFT_239663 [Lipomyces tetrasporus]KAJ8098796.1 hypothetical protein POJ06DRAFT_239663 [Lipomyces tetrasporus]